MAAAEDTVAQGHAESVSAWVNDALRLKADRDRRLAAMDEFIAAYEAEHGEISEEEMAEVWRGRRGRQVPVAGAFSRPRTGPGPRSAKLGQRGTRIGHPRSQ